MPIGGVVPIVDVEIVSISRQSLHLAPSCSL